MKTASRNMLLTSAVVCILLVANFALGNEPKTVFVALQVRGEVWMGSDPAKAVSAERQFSASEISLAKNASVLLVYQTTGAMQRLIARRPVTVRLTNQGAVRVDGLSITKIPGKIPAGSLACLPDFTTSGVGRSRGFIDPAGPFCSPVHGSLVVTNQPPLVWARVEGVSRYQVTLMRGTDTLLQEQTSDNRVSIKALLKPGEYHWMVTHELDGSAGIVVDSAEALPTKKMTFRVASAPVVEEVQSLLRLAEENPDESVLLHFCAKRLNHLKLFAESTAIFEQLKELDENSKTVLASLYKLYRMAGRENDARDVDEKLTSMRLPRSTPGDSTRQSKD